MSTITTPRINAGFSLVEIMVALAIGAIMITGLIQIFLANRQSYRVMEGANFMQENLRFTIDRVTLSLRMADHWGSAEASRDRVTGGATGTPCTAGWARDVTVAIWGADGSPGVPGSLTNCIPAANYQPNTDAVVVRYAGPDPIPWGTTLTSSQWYVRVGAGGNQPYAAASLHLGSGVPLPQEGQTLVYVYNAELFWVRRCSDPGADNTCGTGDDGDRPDPIPTLMRSYLDSSGVWTSEPMAEGVEQFQLEYQTMNGPWMSATEVTALPAGRVTQWRRITGVRIAGVMRSAQKDLSFPADTRSFNLSDDTPNYTAPSTLGQYLRVAYEANAAIRPRVRPAPAL